MLRITWIADGGPGALFKLEGKLLGPWVEELTRACTDPTEGLRPVRLDLTAVTFVDEAGLRCLCELLRGHARLAACSGLVAELLRLEAR